MECQVLTLSIIMSSSYNCKVLHIKSTHECIQNIQPISCCLAWNEQSGVSILTLIGIIILSCYCLKFQCTILCLQCEKNMDVTQWQNNTAKIRNWRPTLLVLLQDMTNITEIFELYRSVRFIYQRKVTSKVLKFQTVSIKNVSIKNYN